MSNNGPRYRASTDRADVGHRCCYEAAVVDTTAPRPDWVEPGETWHRCVAECGSIEEAELIATALNRLEMDR